MTPDLSKATQQVDSKAITNVLCEAFHAHNIVAKASMRLNCLHVILESVDVPDQAMCVGLVHHVIEDLEAESLTQVRVYGRERGEDFPAWEEDVELRSRSIANTTELAQHGDIAAITTLITQWLNTSTIAPKVSLKGGCLRILLETNESLDSSQTSSTLFKHIQRLAIQDCTQLKISSREPGDEFFDWQQEFTLAQTIDAPQNTLEILPRVKLPFPSLNIQIPESTARPQSGQLELARKGDAQAITNVMNYLLDSKDLVAGATLTGDCLLVTLQSEEIPDQEQTTNYVRKVLKELKLNLVKRVKLYGRRKNSTFTAWTDELTLDQPQSGSIWDAVAGTFSGATGAISGAVTSTGEAIAGTATSVAGSIGGVAMHTTDGMGYVVDMLTSSPHLQELTTGQTHENY